MTIFATFYCICCCIQGDPVVISPRSLVVQEKRFSATIQCWLLDNAFRHLNTIYKHDGQMTDTIP